RCAAAAAAGEAGTAPPGRWRGRRGRLDTLGVHRAVRRRDTRSVHLHVGRGRGRVGLGGGAPAGGGGGAPRRRDPRSVHLHVGRGRGRVGLGGRAPGVDGWDVHLGRCRVGGCGGVRL